MQALRTDIISLFDIDFKKTTLGVREMEYLRRCAITNDPVQDLYITSFEWVFYGENLPGCERFFFDASKFGAVTNIECCTLIVRPENGAGVFSIWQTFGRDTNPFLQRQTNLYELFIPLVEKLLGTEIDAPDRVYPFVSLTVDTDDVAKYSDDNAEELGKIFTGYFEEDEKAYLLEIMRSNLSKRRYERLFVRWTDVLAIYSRSMDKDQQKKTMLRAAQIYETCILLSRLCKNLSEEADGVSSRLWRPKPRATDRILMSLLEIERQFVVAPPVQSVEAGNLLSGAYKSFGMDNVIGGARSSCQFLERRSQWVKAQFLVVIGVLAYLLDKLEVFKWIAKHLCLGS